MGDRRRLSRGGSASRHRWQGIHPVTGARFSLTARTAGDLAELVARARRIGHELRAGVVSLEQANTQCEELTRGKTRVHRLIVLGDAWRDYVATQIHPDTRGKLGSVWKHYLAPLEHVPVASFTDGKLEELVAKWMGAGLSPKYVTHTIWAFLSAAIRHAKRARKIERLPWDEFRPPRAIVRRRPAAATKVEHVARCIAVARADDALEEARGNLGDMHRRIGVLCLSGMRNGEGAGLGWDHVDFETELLTIAVQAIDQWQKHFPEKTRPDFHTKNAKASGPLVQRMHPDVKRLLLAQRDALRARGWYRDDGPVFPTRGGAWRKNANCIYPEDMKAIAIRAGIPNAARWVTHSLRHSNATLELRSGGIPRDVQKRIGHSTLRQLEAYVHDISGAASAIPSVLDELADLDDPGDAPATVAGKTADGRPPP
jgi:integrase